jgi:hypothetical protein
MQRSNVVPHYNADHGNTSRILDFQRLDTKDIVLTSTCIRPIHKEEAKAMAINDDEVVKDSPEQVSPKLNMHSLYFNMHS